MVPFENDNLQAYKLLLRIEIVLRECLKEVYAAEYGPGWQKRLPGELLKKIKQSQAEENRPQFGHIRLGPLYYLTFGELIPLLQQKPGQSVVKRLGGECILKQLENLFTPRNSVCHSRPVSSVGMKAIEALYAQLETGLTPECMAKLGSTPDVGLAQDEVAKAIIPILKAALAALPKLPLVLEETEVFIKATAQYWWSDDSLSGFNRLTVEAAMSLITEYNALPKGVGAAGPRQHYCEKQDMKKRLLAAIDELEKVMT